ncbi:ABC transporter ATP-binding protein [bacterium]|nr:ABC transporter ATP-binding protein [bacterium]
MSKVVLENVTKKYNDTVAVQSVSLDINPQELLILVGPSGCGKTTTLRMIAGLEQLSSGNIYIDNKKVNDISPRERNVAMVFQNYALYPHMTVYENLAFSLKMRKVPVNVINDMVTSTAKLLAIEDILGCKPRLLSGGQQQRVALGRAIVRRPNIFLFDEPLSNLDAHLRSKMRTELSRLHTRLATTMIYVTHDQVEAMSMGEQIAVMNHGRIQQLADPITIYEKPANKFVAGFFGNPPINFFEGILTLKNDGLRFKSEDWDFPIPDFKKDTLVPYKDKKVIMGLRPEHITGQDIIKTEYESSQIQAHVEVIEPMGFETLVYFSSGTHDFVVRFESNVNFSVAQVAKLNFCLEKSLFFDAETENIIL